MSRDAELSHCHRSFIFFFGFARLFLRSRLSSGFGNGGSRCTVGRERERKEAEQEKQIKGDGFVFKMSAALLNEPDVVVSSRPQLGNGG